MIYEKLQKARVELQNMKLKKSGKNDYAGFTYYELADFLPAINSIFLDLKLHSVFNMNEAFATLKIIDYEDKSENNTEEFTMPMAELELKGCNKIQALGGQNTYLRRYLYLNALEIVESDLFDAQTGKEINKNKPSISQKVMEFNAKLKNAKLTNEQIKSFCEQHKISSKDEKTIEDFLKNNDFNTCLVEFLKKAG